MTSFVHLNVHSHFSLLAGTRHVTELVAAARQRGFSSLALTDTNGLHAAIDFQRACEAAGIRPVLGAELRHEGRKAVVLVRDAHGYAELCRMITALHTDDRFRLSAVLSAASDHVFVLCGDPSLLVGLRGRDTVYVELVCHHDVPSRRRKYQLLDVAARLGLQPVATNNVHFVQPDEFEVHRVLCAMRTNSTVGTLPEGATEHPGCFLRSPGEMQALFDDVPEALENTAHIAWSCSMTIPLGHPQPPGFVVPEQAEQRQSAHHIAWRRGVAERLPRDATGQEPRILRTGSPPAGSIDWPTRLRGREAAGSVVGPPDGTTGETDSTAVDRARTFHFLQQLCDEGLAARLGAVTDAARHALQRELDVIRRLDLTEYFLVCWDLVRFARAHGMPCLGRGSAANSLVSFCLYITHVNPLEHNLFFERFLNLERENTPDFDIDFGTDDREVVLDYIFERYGRDRVAMICTFVTMHARSAIREVAKALGVPQGEIDAVVKRLPHFASARDVRQRIQGDAARRDLPLDREPLRSILALAERIAEFPHHLATHPCGLVIAPRPILDIVPLQRGDKGLEITQWNMDGVEDAGLIKIDILGQKGLAVISDTIRQVEHNDGLRIDPERIDVLGDARGRDLLRSGRTIGCFYIESPIMLQLMEQAACDDFEVLTALSSIIRPGVSNHGGKREYLECHLGLRQPQMLHPLLEPVLRDTYGCLIYQEQVIQVAQAIAGMTLAESDGLRKCMSKKRNWQRMETYRERFLSGARRNDVPQDVAVEIFRRIESFAGYAFCKAHSASFAVESFESAYWKSHHPAEFMAAVLTNQGGYYTPLEYSEEARRCGVEVLAPCVQESRDEFWGRERHIRTGLMQVKGLTQAGIDALLSSRTEAGPFVDLGDLLRRVPLSHPEVDSLIRCGALGTCGTQPRLLWELALRSRAAREASGAAAGQQELHWELADTPRMQHLLQRIPDLPAYADQERMQAELEILELTLGAHPFALFSEVLEWVRAQRPIVDSRDLRRFVGREVYLLGWKVTAKQTRTVHDESMCFVTFSDPHGRFEVSFFPEVYEQVATELVRGYGPYLIKGEVEVTFGVAEVIGRHLKLLSPRTARRSAA